jgi:hypothetical protein
MRSVPRKLDDNPHGTAEARVRGLLIVGLAVSALVTYGAPAVAQTDAGVSGSACRLGSSPMVRAELIFGTERQSLPPVTDEEWKTFVDDEIAQRFPDGFTLLDGQGEWRGSRGIVREKSHVLIIWYSPSPEQQDKIEALRSIYKKRFGQDSVARIDGSDCVAF